MKLPLKEVMHSSQDGCIRNNEEITKILTNLLSTQVRQFPQKYRKSIYELLSCSLEWLQGMDDEEFGQLTYLDLICLSDIGIKVMANGDKQAEHNCLYLFAESLLLQLFKDSCKYNTWVSLFGSVNVIGLFNTFDDLAGSPHKSFDELLRTTAPLSEHWIKYDITPQTTLKELLTQTDDIVRQFWRPWQDIEGFSKRVNVGYDVLTLIVYKHIKTIYSKHFRAWVRKANQMAI